MLAALLAAALFSTHLTVPFPGAVRVAIVAGRVIAASESGAGMVIEGSRIVSTFAAGPHPSSIAVADLDGDGKPDLAIANHEQKSLTLAFGDAFARTVQVAVPDVTPHVHSVAAADLDGDGKIDLVLNDMGGRRVLILWGNGDGTFSAPTATLTGSKGYAYIDVAVLRDRLFVPSWPQAQVAVLRVQKRIVTAQSLLELPNPAFYAVAIGSDIAVATYSGTTADRSRDGIVLLRDGGRDGSRVARRVRFPHVRGSLCGCVRMATLSPSPRRRAGSKRSRRSFRGSPQTSRRPWRSCNTAAREG
jgi:hypothetical protein